MNTGDDRVDPPPSDQGDDLGPDRPTTSTPDSANGARVIRAGATLGATAAAELRREANALLARSVHALVIDLTAVRDAEPAAASTVLRDLAFEAGDADVDLRIVRGPAAPEVTRALLDDETLFEIYPSVAAALGDGAGTSPPGDGPGHPPAPGER